MKENKSPTIKPNDPFTEPTAKGLPPYWLRPVEPAILAVHLKMMRQMEELRRLLDEETKD